MAGSLVPWSSLRRRIWPHGPAVTIVLSTVVVFALGLAAVGLAFLVPRRGMVIGQEYAVTQAYAFDHLALNTEYLGVDVEACIVCFFLHKNH